jgi:hypothetical protein
MSYHTPSAHEETYRGCTVRLEYDEDPLNPRKEYDNVGTMVCWHRRYNLGDEQPRGDPSDYLLDLARQAVSDRYPELLLRANCERILAKHYVILDLYLYDHGGITISCSPFSCPWDSGRVGFIYCDLKKALHEWGVESKHHLGWDGPASYGDGKRTVREAAADYLKGEVETYDAYLTGRVVGFVAEDPDGETIDSCWGFYPDESKGYAKRYDDPISQARTAIDHWHEKQDAESAEAQHWAERDTITTS